MLQDKEIMQLKEKTKATQLEVANAINCPYTSFRNYFYGYNPWPADVKKAVIEYLKTKAKDKK
jgi:hypothetical protein